MHDDFEPIGAIVERLVNGMAPAPREGETGATALAGTGGTRRAHHDARGGAGVVIWVNFRRSGAAQPEGPTWPPRHSTIDTVSDFIPSKNTPATGGLGNRLRRKM